MTASLSSDPRPSQRAGQRGLHALAVTATASKPLRLVAQPEGLLQIHTAPFRGSAGTVFSQALRAAGLGSRVLIGQFLKGGVDQGPDRSPTLCGRLRWVRPAMEICLDGPVALQPSAEQTVAAIASVWALCRAQLLAAACDLMVLDELGLAIAYGCLPLDEVVATLEQRPGQMDVILCGPAIPEPLLAMADQVTQLRRGH